MHEYMTRHMVARQSMTYAGSDLRAGDRFIATPDDEAYLERCGKAQGVPAPKLQVPAVASTFVAPPAPPVADQVEPTAADVPAAETVAETAAALDQTPAAEAPAAPRPRRRLSLPAAGTDSQA